MTFVLHPVLRRDSIALGRFPLSLVLLINDAAYPWFVLVPEREGIANTFELTPADHAALWEESQDFGAGIMRAFKGDRLNVAALGNMVPQLHVHHIVRYEGDPAWPGPVWGRHPMQPYERDGIQEVQDKLAQAAIANLVL